MTPVVTYAIIGITVLISYRGFSNREFLERFMMNPFQVKYDKEYYRIFSHGFIHANTLHLFVNMFVFWSFGQALEKVFVARYDEVLGRLLFIGLYFGSIAFATIPAMRNHKNNPEYNSLGASGAVSAVLIATMLLFPTQNVYLFAVIPLKAFVAVILFFVAEAYMHKRGKSFIAHDAHIYGAYFGVLFLLALDYHYISNFFREVTQYVTTFLG